mmetsp:Transcript_23729/g.47200  ORF Transcript_23729/g.47200 Transcript_23729/m.47200 type:complete len:80 (-) Transcript_23729:1080-1319(-)
MRKASGADNETSRNNMYKCLLNLKYLPAPNHIVAQQSPLSSLSPSLETKLSPNMCATADTATSPDDAHRCMSHHSRKRR